MDSVHRAHVQQMTTAIPNTHEGENESHTSAGWEGLDERMDRGTGRRIPSSLEFATRTSHGRPTSSSPSEPSRLSIGFDEKFLTLIQHLNLDGRITFRSDRAKGFGGYSEVFQGRCIVEGRPGETDVAIKRLRFHLADKDFQKLLEKEVYVWSKLQHPNVLGLLGYAFCTDTGFPLLVSEWMPFGTAWTYVRGNPQLQLSDILALVTDIACGLEYLHKSNVVHSDIKSDNIVVSADRRALICDFGCARMIQYSCSIGQITSTTKGTDAFWAPEIISMNVAQSKETDVWAFGMTVFELTTRKRPFQGVPIPVLLIARGEVPSFPDWPAGTPIGNRLLVEDICKLTWSTMPNLRPSMSTIVERLAQNLLHNLHRSDEEHVIPLSSVTGRTNVSTETTIPQKVPLALTPSSDMAARLPILDEIFEQLPTLSTSKDVFRAYEETLENHGLDASYDVLYYDYLLRIASAKCLDWERKFVELWTRVRDNKRVGGRAQKQVVEQRTAGSGESESDTETEAQYSRQSGATTRDKSQGSQHFKEADECPEKSEYYREVTNPVNIPASEKAEAEESLAASQSAVRLNTSSLRRDWEEKLSPSMAGDAPTEEPLRKLVDRTDDGKQVRVQNQSNLDVSVSVTRAPEKAEASKSLPRHAPEESRWRSVRTFMSSAFSFFGGWPSHPATSALPVSSLPSQAGGGRTFLPQLSRTPPRVLLIVDDVFDRNLAQRAFVDLGALVDSIHSNAVNEKIVGAKYDVVVIDVKAPVGTGVYASLLVRSIDASVPIISITGKQESPDIAALHEQGISGIVPKPLNKERLIVMFKGYCPHKVQFLIGTEDTVKRKKMSKSGETDEPEWD